MRYALSKEHLDFYYRHRYIEFEDLLSPAEVETLEKALEKILAKRLNTVEKTLPETSFKDLYHAGHDAWRDDEQIKKFSLRTTFAEIASNLSKVRPLRIGYDQIILASNHPAKIFAKPFSLSECSSVQKIVCGLILNLNEVADSKDTELLHMEGERRILSPLPRKTGSGIFISPDLPISYDYLAQFPYTSQLLIAYTEDKAIYTHTEQDPHNHFLKKFGYVFGDRLRTTTHPVIYQG